MTLLLECAWCTQCHSLEENKNFLCFVRVGILCILHLLNARLFSGLTSIGLVHSFTVSVSLNLHQPYCIRKTLFSGSHTHNLLQILNLLIHIGLWVLGQAGHRRLPLWATYPLLLGVYSGILSINSWEFPLCQLPMRPHNASNQQLPFPSTLLLQHPTPNLMAYILIFICPQSTQQISFISYSQGDNCVPQLELFQEIS